MAVFADAAFYVALLLPRDQHRSSAARAAQTLIDEPVVTSEPVLVEVLAAISRAGPQARTRAVDLVDVLLEDTRVTVVEQTHELFRNGIDLYRRRLDKGYSLTDCMSMVICNEQQIRQVLTTDRHFTQEGFEILL